MGESDLFRSFFQVLKSIENCLDRKLIIPALVLIYVTIDSVSWLYCEDDKKTGKVRFCEWVDNFILDDSNLQCTSLDLYAARCGILHTLSPVSDLSKNKKARIVSYAWGVASLESLEKTTCLIKYPNTVSIHVDDLYSSLKKGLEKYFLLIENDKDKKILFIEKIKSHFVHCDDKYFETILKMFGNHD